MTVNTRGICVHTPANYSQVNGQNRGRYAKTKGKITLTCEQVRAKLQFKNGGKNITALQSRGKITKKPKNYELNTAKLLID